MTITSAMLFDLFRLGLMAALAWAMSAYFWLPAIVERPYVAIDRLLDFDFHQWFPSVARAVSTDLIPRYGMVVANPAVYPYRLGLLQGLFLACGLVALLWPHRRWPARFRIEAGGSLLVAAIALFFVFPVSTPIWDRVPLLPFTQFPWRLLAFVGLPAAVLAGLFVNALPCRVQPAGAALLAGVVVISCAGAIAPLWSTVRESDLSPFGSLAFEQSYGFVGTTTGAEYLPVSAKERTATSALALSALLDKPIAPHGVATVEAVERHYDRVVQRPVDRQALESKSGRDRART